MINYKQFNEVARENGVVFLGSTYFNSIPVSELAQDYDTELPVYNRSIEGLTIDRAGDMLDGCVIDLKPSKVFICLGDEDIRSADFDAAKFIENYRWLLYMLHNRCKAKIYMVSVLSLEPAASAVNERLKKLAAETGCQYVDAAAAIKSNKPTLRLFAALRYYMRSHPITFNEAMMA